jgi:hypothetical protein
MRAMPTPPTPSEAPTAAEPAPTARRTPSRRTARSRLARIAGALAVGACATIVSVFAPIATVERGRGAVCWTIHRGHHLWHVAADEVAGLRWWNLQLSEQPLRNAFHDGEIAPWAEPPLDPPAPVHLVRIAQLGAGWPEPALRIRWTVDTPKQAFPMPAEIDDQDTSIVYAAEAFLGMRPGGPFERTILWRGAIVDTVFFGALSLVAYGLVRRFAAWRARRAHSAGR